ncbi:MAG TPA: hypothetical protein VKX46_20175 [Ktedonobacteraceae bacterium]|nr:hypothetical protein [Ktedonobacteraceae bacterium]
MRGKLRDKNASQKRAGFKREEFEQRRPHKRDNRMTQWVNAQLEEEDDDYDFDLEAEEAELETEQPH